MRRGDFPSSESDTVWVPVVNVSELRAGQGRCFLIGPHRVALFLMRDGAICAIDAACPHRGGPLADGLAGCGTVICPLHGYKFAFADGRGLDSDLRLSVFATELRDGHIHVRLPG